MEKEGWPGREQLVQRFRTSKSRSPAGNVAPHRWSENESQGWENKLERGWGWVSKGVKAPPTGRDQRADGQGQDKAGLHFREDTGFLLYFYQPFLQIPPHSSLIDKNA